MEKGNTWLLGLLIACLVVSLGTLGVAFNQPDPASAKDIASQIVVPSAPSAPEIDVDALATAVASKITVPTPESVSTGTNTDSSSSDRLCELTNNCKKCFDFDYSDSEIVQDKLEANDYRKLKQSVKEITELVIKDYDYFDVELKDSYNYAKTCKEGDKGNFEVQTLYRIDYNELDNHDDDSKVVYVLVTSNVEDNEDVSIVSVEKVDRKFEIVKN